jgi:hypothetical protein
VVAAAGESDPGMAAQGLAHVQNVAVTDQAYQKVKKRHGWLDRIWHDVTTTPSWAQGIEHFESSVGATPKSSVQGIGQIAKVANMGMGESQHEYRFVRDTFHQRGVVDGFAAVAPIVAGEALGSFVGPGGAAIGGVAGGELSGRVLFSKMWKSSERSGGSPGRDLIQDVGLGRNRVLSGVVDGAFDLMTDPVVGVGKMAELGRTAEGAPGMLNKLMPGVGTHSVEAVDLAFQKSSSYRNALRDISTMQPAEVRRFYPKLRPIADRLGNAGSEAGVHAVFRDLAERAELSNITPKLPTLTTTKAPFRMLTRAMQDTPDAVDRILVRPFERQPAGWDRAVGEFSNKRIDVTGKDAPEMIRRLARGGVSARVANDFSDDFANTTDVRQRVGMLTNILTHVATQVDPTQMTPEAASRLKAEISGLLEKGENVHGFDMDRNPIDRLPLGEDVEAHVGFRAGQEALSVPLPDWLEYKRGWTRAGNLRQFLRDKDDWVYNHITTPFKQLAMLNPASGQRIALSELIPNALYNGVMRTVKTTAAKKYAEWGLKEASGEELSRVADAVYQRLGGHLEDSEAVRRATLSLLHLDGQEIPHALQAHAGGGYSDLPLLEQKTQGLRRVAQTSPVAKEMADDIKMVRGPDPMEIPRWHAELRDVSRDPASRAAAKAAAEHPGSAVGVTAGEVDEARRVAAKAASDYIRAHPEIYDETHPRFNNQFLNDAVSGKGQLGLAFHEDWADHWGHAIAEGLFGSGGGYKIAENSYGLNKDILSALADANPTDFLPKGRLSKEALEAIPEAQRPWLPTAPLVPDTSGKLTRVASVGWRRVMNPIINHVAREPVFNAEFDKQYDMLQPLVRKAQMSEDHAVMLAHQRASEEMITRVHNPIERSQLGHMVRNFAPFYFAQEQAYRRASLLVDNPAAFRRYMLVTQGFMGAGHVTSDSKGQGYLNIPGAGFLTDGVIQALHGIGGPVPVAGSVSTGLSSSLSSMGTVFPLAEDPVPWHRAGPIATIPLHLLQNIRPETAGFTKAVLGPKAAGGSIWDEVVPNGFLRNAIHALGIRDSAAQFNSMVATMQNLDFQQQQAMRAWIKDGHSPQDPGRPQFLPNVEGLSEEQAMRVQQRFISRVRNQSRVYDMVKAVVGLVSPGSPRVDIGKHLTDEFNAYIKKYGDIATAVTHYLHGNPDASAYTISKHTGERIPATKQATDWVMQNLDFVKQYPDVASYFVPQAKGDAYSQAAANELTANGLQERKVPAQFLDDLYKAHANAQFFDHDLPIHKEAMKKVVGDPEAEKAERKRFSNYIQTEFGPQNPTWWAELNSPARVQKRQQQMTQLIELFGTGRAPDTPQARDIGKLLEDFSVHQHAMNPGRPIHVSRQGQLVESHNWDNFLHQLVAQQPQLRTIINALFRDPKEVVIPEGEP